MFLTGDLDLFIESSDFIEIDDESDSMVVWFKDETMTTSVSSESFGDGGFGFIRFLDIESIFLVVIFEFKHIFLCSIFAE